MLKLEVGQKWIYAGESGGFYTKGREYEIMSLTTSWYDGKADVRMTSDSGTSDNGGYGHAWDEDSVRREFTPKIGPVRERTIREIVDGTYSDVTVTTQPDGDINIHLKISTKSKPRILSAAMILSQIAEALEDQE